MESNNKGKSIKERIISAKRSQKIRFAIVSVLFFAFLTWLDYRKRILTKRKVDWSDRHTRPVAHPAATGKNIEPVVSEDGSSRSYIARF